MNNFTYFNDEWNSPIVEGTSQPLPASQLMENSPTHNKPKNVQ
jgi:hypothetical protein